MGKSLILQAYCVAALLAFAVVGISTIVFADTSTTSVLVGNATPTVTNVSIGPASITLTENATTAVHISATITDTNGCGDVITSGTVRGILFREGVSSTCAASELSCYRDVIMIASTSDTCAGGADTTVDAYGTANVYYFADATDASSSFATQSWFLSVKAIDDSDASSTATDTTSHELNTLVALNVSSTITHGTVAPGSNTGATNQNATTSNTGNNTIDLDISASDMTGPGNPIVSTNQKYGTTNTTYADLPFTATSSPPAQRAWNIGRTTASTSASVSSTFWGIAIPSGQASGTYTGTNTFTALWST